MGIVSDLPFCLDFVVEYENYPLVKKCSLFFDCVEDALNSTEPTVVIQENDPVSIMLTSEKQCRLYLDALDIVPIEYGCQLDNEGRVFFEADGSKLPLYQPGKEFDELRVDNFLMEVIQDDLHVYGWLKICPKQLIQSEWEMMVSDLEHEAIGLAQDIVQRNIGMGDLSGLAIPPKQLRQFLIFQKRAQRFLAALHDIAENPRFSIRTEYVQVERNRDVATDVRSIREGLRKPDYSNSVMAPRKVVCYDTPENRQLKKIVKYCTACIREFNATIKSLQRNAEAMTQHIPYMSTSQYRLIYERNLNQYRDTSEKLIKMAGVIASKEWYKSVSDTTDGRGTHAFALDPCFAYIDKVYRELREEEFKIQIDPAYSFSWKKSSHLYEVWCFITICRALGKNFFCDLDSLISRAGDGLLFPQLQSGKQVLFSNDDCLLRVAYDRRIPSHTDMCSIETDPYYTDGVHNRPDIRIDIYHNNRQLYLGSIVIECKYRRIKNFYRNGTHNSREQISAYYDEAQTTLYFGRLAEIHDIRPVLRVFAVTPDDAALPRGLRDKHVLVRKMRPGCNAEIEDLRKEILGLIEGQVNKVKDM